MSDNKFSFTRAALDALPCPDQGKRSEYWDAKTPGLMVRVTSTGSKSFYIKRWASNGTERVLIGKYPAVTIAQARQKAIEVNAIIAKGESPSEKKRADRAEMTFAKFWEEYQERYSRIRKKPRTIEEEQKTFRNYLAPLANRKLSKLSKQDCHRLHHDIAAKTSGATANRALAVLSGALSVAMDWGYLSGDNPAKSVKRFKEVARDRYIQSDEMPRFWQALLDEPNRAFADAFMIALMTGMRRTDVLSMRWDQISLERGEWRIPDPKNGEPLTVPLVGEVMGLLKERRQSEPGAWVFPGKGKSGHLVEPKTAWKRILERAGIEDIRLHDLRRTLGSSMAAMGVNTITTARTMGHKTLTMALRYQQLSTDPKRAAIEAGAGAILADAGARASAEVIPLRQAKG